MSERHLHGHTAEFDFRYNTRLDTRSERADKPLRVSPVAAGALAGSPRATGCELRDFPAHRSTRGRGVTFVNLAPRIRSTRRAYRIVNSA